jgi:hypothetical protein
MGCKKARREKEECHFAAKKQRKPPVVATTFSGISA